MKDILKFILGAILISFSVACDDAKIESETSSISENRSVGQSGVVDDMSNPNVVQVAISSADHSTLVAALQAADYVDALTNVGPFTVFAPVNAAFDQLPAGTLESLVKPENQRKLRDILEYHVLLGVYKKADLVHGRKMGTADGRSVEIEILENGDVLVNGGKIIGTVEASNGVIHVIDKVLVPN